MLYLLGNDGTEKKEGKYQFLHPDLQGIPEY